MDGIVTLLLNPISIFGLLFFAFGIRNLVTWHIRSAVVYLVLSLAITLGGVWVWGKAATSHGPKLVVQTEEEREASNTASHGTALPRQR